MAFPLASKKKWASVARSIRMCNFKMCQGGINSGFFSGDNADNASVIFLLYFLTKHATKSKKTQSLIGFVLANDLRFDREDDDIDPGTLYIDAICTNTDVRQVPPEGLRGAGKLLLDNVEQYAQEPHNELDAEPFTNVRLTSLPYVVAYYRRQGYRHIHRCGYEERADITEQAEKAARLRFKTNDDLDLALKVELAKSFQFLEVGVLGEREKKDFLIANLNKYFTPEGIKFLKNSNDEIYAYSLKRKKQNNFITSLITTDNSAILNLFNILREYRFAVSCDDLQARHMRHSVMKDTDGDIEFHCVSEGFTMRKCFSRALSGGGGKRASLTKTIKKVSRNPWDGWSKLSPNYKQKTTMKKKCGKKCFWGVDKSFPVCKKNTCRKSKKGVWAAYIRAKQMQSKKTKKLIKKKNNYTKIIKKARTFLKLDK